MPDKELPPDFAEAIHAQANSDSSRHEWKSQPGFNTVSLGAWLDVCKAAGVEAVPATEIGKIAIAHLIVAIDDPESTEENDATRALRAFWTKIEATKKPGIMIRWDCCTCSEVKHRLDTGRHEWHRDLLDCFYVDDFRATDLILEYPDTVIPAWSRPWMQARIVDGYPVEYRVFVEEGQIIGISSYYPQRPLTDSPQVRDDVAACLVETEKLIASVPIPLKFPALAPRRHAPDRKAFTADFMRLEDGRFLYLEGGPPFCSGAHPCCFENFDNWSDAAAFHFSGVPVALKGTES